MGSQCGFNIILLHMQSRIFLPIEAFLLAMALKAPDCHITRGIVLTQGVSSKQVFVNTSVRNPSVVGLNSKIGM